MAHIKVVRRSMRPEEWTDLRFGWLKRYIYSSKWEINNLMIKDARQISEMEFEYYSDDYRPLNKGDMYFTPDGTAFIKADVDIPKELQGKELWFSLKTAAEICVKVNGKYVGGVDPNRERMLLSPYVDDTKTLHFEMMGYNRSKPDDERNPESLSVRGCRQIFEGAYICTVNHKVQDLVWDFELLLDIAKSDLFNEDYRAFLNKELNNAMNFIDFDSEELDGIDECQKYLDDVVFANDNYKGNGDVALIAHSHLDIAYYWRRIHAVQKNLRTVLIQLRLMDKYPDLVKEGTYYYDFPELSGKYYSKEDLKEIVTYAGTRGIEIIPEVDLPGHSIALLAALPELSCRGGKFEATPEERDWNKRKRGNENMICIGNPQSFAFAEDVIDALIEIFPSQYIHFGGDEVPTDIWEKCPKCMALYKREGMKSPGEIQDYFTRKMSDLIRSKGKIMIGWGEINDRNAAGPNDVLTIWRDNGVEKQKIALEHGISVIMCPQHGCYFDWGYAGNSTRKVYEWNPVSEGVTAEQQALIKGGQAALWTERITTMDRVEWMLYPRICALSEVLWSEPSARNWDDFYQRITTFYPVMKKLGINYYEDDAMNEKEFVPSNEKPALVRNAHIDTNIPGNPPYHAEYAFDGKSNTFFWGGTSVGPEHYFTIVLGEPMKVNEVKVITGDSKDYITMADLLISEDGENFVKVGKFDDLGQASATPDAAKTIKAVKIQITGQHTCWPIIKEIILK